MESKDKIKMDSGMAATDTKKKQVAKNPEAAAKKSKVKEEVVISSSDESNFDDAPDSVEVPSGGKDLNMISKNGTPTSSKVDGRSVIPLKRERVIQQPGYEQGKPQAMAEQRVGNSAAGDGHTRLILPANVQSRRKSGALQGGPAVSPSGSSKPQLSGAPLASTVGQSNQIGTPQQQTHDTQQSFGLTPAAVLKMLELLKRCQSEGGDPRKNLFAKMIKDHQANAAAAAQHEKNFIEEEETMGIVETYAEYKPAKLNFGEKHPDPVVETASLSSVLPPDVWYRLSLPNETIDNGLLSALQLEAVTYACQQHEQILHGGVRAGYLVGDGAGVGKGRTVSGIIFENHLKGRQKAIWVSISSDLIHDAVRDLKDIGAGKILVHPFNKMNYDKISDDVNGQVKTGVIFSTYSSLIGESQSDGKVKTRLKQLLEWCEEDFDGVIVFDECHRAKHLNSAKPTKTGIAVLEIQNKLPKARIVYASATGASEPRNMAYMVRLGLWGEGTLFPVFDDFLEAIEEKDVGAMEMVAMEMKLRGMYIARQLSFKDVTFEVVEVPLSPKFIKVYDESVKLWVQLFQAFTEATKLVKGGAFGTHFWSAHQRFFKYLCIAAKVKHAVKVANEAVESGKCVVIGLQSTGEARTLEQKENEGGLFDFVSTAKAVLQSLVEKNFPAPSSNDSGGTSSRKRKASAQEAAESIKKRPRAVNLDSEEESNEEINDQMVIEDSSFEVDDDGDESEDDLGLGDESEDDLGDGSKDLEADESSQSGSDDSDTEDPWRPSSENAANPKNLGKKKDLKKASSDDSESEDEIIQPKRDDGFGDQPSQADLDAATRLKDKMLTLIEKLGKKLPPNTLDQLIGELGGPGNVAEMTGRKGRIVQNVKGEVQYESRSEVDIPPEQVNIEEKKRFMNGDKNVAIISEAASSGISLQADRRVKNQRKRVHVTLELPWSADRAIQQFGRTHRSNQVSAPEYIFLISEMAGERRFASIVAQRLESLGALTHGDRRATESRDLSQFNIDNKYGRAALDATMEAVMGLEDPVVPPPTDYKGNFFKDVTKALIGVGLISKTNQGDLELTENLKMKKFLNRILGMPVDLQNHLFQYFTDTMAAIVATAKKLGRFDLGILDLGGDEDKIHCTRLYTFMMKNKFGTTGKIELRSFDVERGMSWDEAKAKLSAILPGSHEGFYMLNDNRCLNGKPTPILVVQGNAARREADKGEPTYTIIRPYSGYQLRQEPLDEIKSKSQKVQPDEAEPHWKVIYNATKSRCLHAFYGKCRQTTLGISCHYGLHMKTYNVLSGSVLSVWTKVESVMSSHHVEKTQAIRLRSKGTRIVGPVVPHSCMVAMIKMLTKEAQTVSEESFPKNDPLK